MPRARDPASLKLLNGSRSLSLPPPFGITYAVLILDTCRETSKETLLICRVKCLRCSFSPARARAPHGPVVSLGIQTYNVKLLRFQRHSIHGMMEEENVVRPHQEMASLSLQEKKYLLAVERGDVASVRRRVEYITIELKFHVSLVRPQSPFPPLPFCRRERK